MTRAGYEADRKARWCDRSGKDSAVNSRVRYELQCCKCGRWFRVPQVWYLERRLPHHKQTDQIKAHHRPSTARLV